MFEKGQKVNLEIIDISNEGKGIGKVDGLAVFVEGTVVGDKVEAELTKIKKNYAFAKLISIVESSKNRIEAFCSHYSECGGCIYGTTEYNLQKQIKEKQIKDRLVRIGGIPEPTLKSIVSMEEPFYYRNKAVFQISTGGNIMRKGGVIENIGEPSVGFYKRKSNLVVNCNECFLHLPPAVVAARAMRQFMIEDNITAWDSKWEQGLMKSMTIKTASCTREVMVILDINGKGIPNGNKLIDMLDSAIYESGYFLESVYLDMGKELKVLAGKKVIKERLGNLEFEISPNSFYQVNPEIAVKLFDTVKRYAGLTGKEKVLDLYCGVGSIGLWCAENVGYIVGIESVKEAVLDANRNASINGIVNARYICGKAEEELPKLLENQGDEDLVKVVKEADVVILDPPRAGCHDELLNAVVEVSPQKIVYVSCDPSTLARDIKALEDRGYQFVEGTPFDMFPWTGHVEAIVLLQKKNS